MAGFLKTPYWVGGLGVVGAPALGVGGWQIYEEANPTADRVLRRQGYKWKPTSSDFTGTASIQSNYVGGNRCFREFFRIPLTLATGESLYYSGYGTPASGPAISSESDMKSEPTQTGITESKVVGCAQMSFMNMYNPDSSTNQIQQLFNFYSELTFRGGRVGLYLFSFGAYEKKLTTEDQDASSAFMYSLLFLEKDNEEQWKIKSGYSWLDNKLTGKPGSVPFFPYVASPGHIWSGESAPTKVTVRKENYSGIWEEGGNRGILQDIVIKKDNSAPAEILGIGDFEFNVADAGYKKVGVAYRDSKWRDYKPNGSAGTEDVSDTLKKWFEPFKGKTGKWTEVKDYCGPLQYSRGLKNNDYVLDNMKRFCFSK